MMGAVGVRAADCVRQYCEFAACVGHGAAERNRRAGVARRHTCANFPAIPDREPFVGDDGRRFGDAAGGSRAAGRDELDAQEPTGNSLRSRPTPEYPRPAFHAWRHAAQRSAFRMLPGVARSSAKCQRHVKGRRQVSSGGRRPQSSAAGAGGCGVRARLDFGRGRGTHPPQFLEPHASRFG